MKTGSILNETAKICYRQCKRCSSEKQKSVSDFAVFLQTLHKSGYQLHNLVIKKKSKKQNVIAKSGACYVICQVRGHPSPLPLAIVMTLVSRFLVGTIYRYDY